MATTQIQVRRGLAGDAEAVYAIIVRALAETNAKDYPASVIDRLVSALPAKVVSKLEDGCYVAVVDGRIAGTGSLRGQTVQSVFVDPTFQGRGVGSALMDAIEEEAKALNVKRLTLQSSITAQPFYARRGFALVAEGSCGEERTIMMSKDMPEP